MRHPGNQQPSWSQNSPFQVEAIRPRPENAGRSKRSFFQGAQNFQMGNLQCIDRVIVNPHRESIDGA
jgi:hypothetical protein